MLLEIDELIKNLRGRGEDENADTIQMLRDKYIRLRAENYARMTQPQLEIHIHYDKDKEDQQND